MASSKKPLLIPKEKENKVENGQQAGGGPLKGFALFMAENREDWAGKDEEAAQEAALAAWKSLDKAEKEAFKLPRFAFIPFAKTEDFSELQRFND